MSKQQWLPIWKKIQIEVVEEQEEKSAGGLVVMRNSTKGDPYITATVIAFDPLAGTDSRSGQRYHTFFVGEKIIVNRQHIQKVNHSGQSYNFINDIFVVAAFGEPQDHPVDCEDMSESDLPSTIAELEDISFRQQASIGKDS